MNSSPESRQPLPEVAEPAIPVTKAPSRPIPLWRLWVPLLIQTAFVVAVPAQAVYTHLTGKTIVLQTVPVDPYDWLRGYHVTLSYDISRIDTLQTLPGWKEFKESPSTQATSQLPDGTPVYVILEAPSNPSPTNAPLPWKPVRVMAQAPQNLPSNQAVLKGVYHYGNLEYGLETYYIPEDQRNQINEDLAQARQQPNGKPQAVVVEVKAGQGGYSVPVSFWVGDRGNQTYHNYRF